MSELLDLSACSLAERFKNRSVTPVDYAHALLDHIARWEPHLNALCRFDPARVRDEALASTRRWAAGAPLSEIDGVPVTIKELIATQGDRVAQGSAAAADAPPATVDAPAAARLREAGAVVIGKTTVPDYAMLSSGLSSLYGITRNPWRLDLNPGGSSSGAAAAAAAGYGPLHVGTDIGGSIRLPAGWCGIVGFKPSNGRIPIEPYYTGRCAGPMTRTIDDAALLMRFLSRPDWRDATSLPPETIDWSIAPAHIKGMRIGLMLDAGCGLAPDPQIVAAVEAAAERFAAHGARIVAAPPVLSRPMLEGLDRFWRARLWADLERLPDAARARILPYIAEWAGQGASVSGVEAVRGFGATFEMRAAAARLFQSVDAVLSPTNVVTGFPAEWAGPTDDPARPFEHIAFTVPWNMGEQPALSINCGFARDGMPIGLQIVGPRFADRLVLQLGRAYEAWRGEVPRWPAPPR
ncbi:amidase [Burkholderia pseudomallei]|uniref:amidase n=1 Tax=Burkholderia pseudomallei TaxID=28450 RepID=UPI00014FA336|nr:amidase [Burkholderia pseudomallei]AHK67013.1 amidase family protein [Burkholderia pseudomallei MSHR520]AIP80313.1 amidase family protein [Burkholderia pseudomallei]APZ17432.1 amidase [Burkholderia pseudomallei]APZ23626.1 amidase [Burkholderia pseudomallei]EBA44814.1 amidase family protein [Burkholderia pseudomallei 305]